MTTNYFCALSIFFMGASAFAGSVSSGGGKFIGTESNPWFLENVPVVTYCVDVNSAAFRPARGEVQQVVRYAIDRWAQTFADRMLKDPYYEPGEIEPYGDVRLATQRFVEVECGAAIDKDLRFQFGGLTPEQQQLLPDYKDYIGVAVRTNYDLATLRGTGFIYVAADFGPNRPTDSEFAEDPWSADQNGILKAVLLHELGHVFGLRHESGKSHIMSDSLIDMIVGREFVQAVRNNPGMMNSWLLNHVNVLNYDPNMVTTECSEYSVKALKELLHLDGGTACVQLRFSHNDPGDNKLRIKILSAPRESGPYYEEGAITSIDGFNGDAKPIIELKVSDEQRVFSRLPADMWGSRLWVGYEKVTQRKFKGTYLNDAGERVENLFGFIGEDGHFQLGAFHNGQLDLEVYSN